MANGKIESEIAGLEGGLPLNGRRRTLAAYPLTLPPILPDGRVPTAQKPRRYRNLVDASGGGEVAGVRICLPSDGRCAMIVRNVGAADVFLSTEQIVSNADLSLGPGETLSFLYPTTPMNALYAAHGAAGGGDLRVLEVLYAAPPDWLADVESGEVGA